jgi:hypothetical protein
MARLRRAISTRSVVKGQRRNKCKAEQRERCHKQNDQHGRVPHMPLTCEIRRANLAESEAGRRGSDAKYFV